MSKIFPINQGVACPLKWSWNTIRLSEATTASCHRVKPVPLDLENFDNFHNNAVWLEHRKLMLQGKFPEHGCQQYCGHIEAQGGVSDRLFHMNNESAIPVELDNDPSAIHVTPSILEIFINNSCNMSCIYCDESNSTRIQKENTKFGYRVPGAQSDIIPIIPKSQNFNELIDKFFLYLDKNYQKLKFLHVLGGEPFYQKEFYRLLDFISANKNQTLKFTVVTNLMTSSTVLEEFVENMKKNLVDRKLQRVDVTVSIDCFGKEQEYVRHGLDLNQWMKNFEYLAKHKWLYLTINSTLTSLTIKTLPDLLIYINQIRKTRPIHHSFGLVDGRPHLHPSIFGPDFFSDDLEKILNLMPSQTEKDILSKKYMTGLFQSVNNSVVNKQLVQDLVCYLNELDRRRNIDWKTVFPWLLEHLRENNYVV